MTQIVRTYASKDVDMVITISTIVENAIKNKAFLQQKRSLWAGTFFEELKTKIDTTVQIYLGADNAKNLRQSTAQLLLLQDDAMRLLSEMNVQLKEDFKADKPRRDELLNQLGFTSYYKGTLKRDQEGLINLLFQFKSNCTAAVKKEIIEKGSDEKTVNAIIGYADTLIKANITQETFKGNRKSDTAEAITAFNDIYNNGISIAKIAANFFKDQPDKKEQFSYAKLSKALNTIKKTAPPAAKS